MSAAYFTIQEVESTITEESARHAEDVLDPGEPFEADLRDALDALDGGCWDNVDVSGDGTIIAYPADYEQDYRTGDYSATQVIITPRRPHWGERLYDLWSERRRQR